MLFGGYNSENTNRESTNRKVWKYHSETNKGQIQLGKRQLGVYKITPEHTHRKIQVGKIQIGKYKSKNTYRKIEIG